jgi:hypothetical protein
MRCNDVFMDFPLQKSNGIVWAGATFYVRDFYFLHIEWGMFLLNSPEGTELCYRIKLGLMSTIQA